MKDWLLENLKGDKIVWGVVFLLSLISILVVYSATGTLAFRRYQGDTEHFLIKHGSLVMLSLFAMFFAHRINYKYYSGLSKIMLYTSIGLLIITIIFGSKLNEASRWLTIPLINQTFQPSDLAKLGLITYLANMLSKNQGNIDDFQKTFLPAIFWSGLTCGLIAYSDMSTAVMLFSTSILLMFIGRVPVKFIFVAFLVASLFIGTALAVGQRLGTVVSRIETFLDADQTSYQSEQAYIAIAKGGALQFSPGQSTQKNFLPHPYSDFIYAIIIEEYGLLGGVFVLFLYLTLLFRGMVTVSRSDKAFGGLISAGLTFLLVIQAMINMGVTVGLGPVTGLPLPLLSMGGTSLLFTGVAIGIILSVSKGEEKVVSGE